MPFTDADRVKSRQVRDEKNASKVLCANSHPAPKYLARLLRDFLKREYVCEDCGVGDIYNNKSLVLEVDHINGRHHDNRPENLRFLCPNCHSMTDTYCGKGNTGSHKVSDEQMISAIKASLNIRQALVAVGLTAKGGNYSRVRELVYKHGLKFRTRL